ncbi:MAG: ABC transporter permease [Alphaproteobacteria bacterium]|nr:ABC transporter permease [Alphaproteobacteria bacterium]
MTMQPTRILALLLAAAVTAIILVPSAIILFESVLSPERTLSLDAYHTVLGARVVRQATWRTFEIAFAVTALCILAGYPLAFAIAGSGPRLRGALIACVIFPFLLSAVVRAFGWNIVIGETGLINKVLLGLGLVATPLQLLHTEIAIILGEAHLLCPYMVLSLLAVIGRIDPNLEAAAQSLGASPPGVFFRVMVPMTLPGLLAGTLLVFALAMTAFATPWLLGGTRSPVLTSLLYRYAFVSFDLPRALAIAGILLILGIGFLLLHRAIARRDAMTGEHAA